MPMGRCLKNDMRAAKKPEAGTKQKSGTNSDAPGSTRQFKQTGKKYSGPNYKQSDPRSDGKSGSLK